MNNEKQKKGFTWVIIILIIIVIGLVGFICYDKGILFNTKNIATEENKKEELDYKEEENKDLSYEEGNLLLEKIKLMNNNFSSNYPIDDVSKISNQDLLLFVAKQLGFGTDFTEDSANDVIFKLFGDLIKLKHESVMCTIDNKPYYVYDASTKQYTFDSNSHGHGSAIGVETRTYYVDGKYTSDDEIMINAKVLYSNYCGDTCMIYAYYTSYQKSINSETPVLGDNSGGPLEYTDNMYEQIKEDLPITTYVFEKTKNGGYNLKSITIK